MIRFYELLRFILTFKAFLKKKKKKLRSRRSVCNSLFTKTVYSGFDVIWKFMTFIISNSKKCFSRLNAFPRMLNRVCYFSQLKSKNMYSQVVCLPLTLKREPIYDWVSSVFESLLVEGEIFLTIFTLLKSGTVVLFLQWNLLIYFYIKYSVWMIVLSP